MQSLVVVPISQVFSEQRAGRAGRTAAVKCYRLYSSDCLACMSRETVPEIQRSNLANVILQLKALGIDDVIGFDFLDPPSSALVCEALVSLHVLGGLDDSGDLTDTGRLMTCFAFEPALSRMIIEAARGCSDDQRLDDMLAVAAVLSAEDLWVSRSWRAPGGAGRERERAGEQGREEEMRRRS